MSLEPNIPPQILSRYREDKLEIAITQANKLLKEQAEKIVQLEEQISIKREQNLRQAGTISNLQRELAKAWQVGDKATLHLEGVVTKVGKHDIEADVDGETWVFERDNTDWVRTPSENA